MRIFTIGFLFLLAVIQFPLWLGKGGWFRVWELEKQVDQVRLKNQSLKERNAKLESEVLDLKDGTESIEERARAELGMIKKEEIFVQILGNDAKLESHSASQVNVDKNKKH